MTEETQEAEEKAQKAIEAEATVQTTMETENIAEREVKMENMEADLRIEMVKFKEVQKEGTQKKGLEVAVLTCQGWKNTRGSWSWQGLYWHAPGGAVRSRDCDSGLEGLPWWLK